MRLAREHWLLLLLIVMAVAVRFLFVLRLDAHHLTWSDERAYDRIALKLAQTGRYESTAYEATPVLPAFLAAVYKVFGHDYRLARLAHASLAGLLVLAVFCIGTEFFEKRTAWLAATITALYPPYIYLSGVLYAEHLFTVLLALTLCCLARWQKRQHFRRLFFAGALLGLATLCRPAAAACWVAVIGYVAWQAKDGRRFASATTLTAAAAVIVLPWTVRNAFVFRHFLPVSTGSGVHLWRGNNDVALGNADDRQLMPQSDLWQERVQQLSSETERRAIMERTDRWVFELHKLDEVECDRSYGQEAWKWIRAHPDRFLTNSFRRLLTLYSAFSRTASQNEATSRTNKLVATVSFYPVLFLGLVGSVVAWRKNRACLLIHGIIVAMALPYILMTSCTRFRLPVDAAWILLASATVTWAISRFTGKR